MAMLRLRFVHSFVDRTGRVRFYFRYRGRQWPLPGGPGTAVFSEEYDALRRQHITPRAGSKVAFGPHTIGSVIEQYLGHKEFNLKASGTRKKYRRVLDR